MSSYMTLWDHSSDLPWSPWLYGASISGPSVWKLRFQFPFSATDFRWRCLHSGPSRQMTERSVKRYRDLLNVLGITDPFIAEKLSPSSEFLTPVDETRKRGKRKRREFPYCLWGVVLLILVPRLERERFYWNSLSAAGVHFWVSGCLWVQAGQYQRGKWQALLIQWNFKVLVLSQICLLLTFQRSKIATPCILYGIYSFIRCENASVQGGMWLLHLPWNQNFLLVFMQ